MLSCDIGVLKPEPAPFRVAVDCLGVVPERALLVDDVPANLDAAGRLGLRTLLIARGPEPFPQPGPHPLIDRLEQVWPFLERDAHGPGSSGRSQDIGCR